MNTLTDTLSTLPEDAKFLVETVMGASADLFHKHGEVGPVGFYILPFTGEIKVKEVGGPFDENTKDAFFDELRVLRRTCPTVAFLSEVWMSEGMKEKDMNPDGTVKVMPRDDPNHSEHIMLNLWQGSRVVTFKAQITRNPTALGEWGAFYDSTFPIKGATDVKGRMVEGESFQMEEN